jgi:hypothetical protein
MDEIINHKISDILNGKKITLWHLSYGKSPFHPYFRYIETIIMYFTFLKKVMPGSL